MVDLLVVLASDAHDVRKLRHQAVGFGEGAAGAGVVAGEKVAEAGLPRTIEATGLAELHLRAREKVLHRLRRNDEVEALHDRALIGTTLRDEREHADHAATIVDRRATAIAAGGRRVGLNHRLAGFVLLEARDGTVGDRGLHFGRRIQELVGEDHARKADDVHGVTDLERAGVAERQRRQIGSLEAQQREVAPRHALTGDGRAVLRDRRRHADAVREHDGDRRLQLDVGRPTAGARRALRHLGVEPVRGALSRGDDVGVRHEPAARADEPSGPGLPERSGLDGRDHAAAIHRDVGSNFRDDERNGRLGAQQDFLKALRSCGSRGRGEDDETDEPEHDHRAFHECILARTVDHARKAKGSGVVPGAFLVPRSERCAPVLLHRGDRGLRLRLGRLHVTRLARGLGLAHQRRGLAHAGRLLRTGHRPRSLDFLAARSLDFLAARSLDFLAARSLDFLATRSLDFLTARSLDFLTARRLDFLPPRSLAFLPPRSLAFLRVRSLAFLTPRSLDFLTARSLNFLASTRQRPRSLNFLTARSLLRRGPRSLDLLTARSLNFLATRSLHFLTTRSLHFLTTRSLDFLTRASQRARRLDVLPLRHALLGQHLLRLRHLGRARRLRVGHGHEGGEERYAHDRCRRHQLLHRVFLPRVSGCCTEIAAIPIETVRSHLPTVHRTLVVLFG